MHGGTNVAEDTEVRERPAAKKVQAYHTGVVATKVASTGGFV